MPPRDSVVSVPIREGFKPYIYVQGESTVPSGITLFAATGGRWNIIELPETLLGLPLMEQLPPLIDLMHDYLDQYGGHCPFFGRVRGFRFVRENDSLQFTTVGNYLGRTEEPFRLPRTELEVAKKNVEPLFG